jgi:hypothetical protein
MEDAVSLAACLRLAGKDNVPWATRVHNKLRLATLSLRSYKCNLTSSLLLQV